MDKRFPSKPEPAVFRKLVTGVADAQRSSGIMQQSIDRLNTRIIYHIKHIRTIAYADETKL